MVHVRNKVVAGNKYRGYLETAGRNKYHGSVRLPSGKFASRFFSAPNNIKALEMWTEWANEQRAATGELARKFRPEPAEMKEETNHMATKATTTAATKPKLPDSIYCVVIVGGAPVIYTADQDKALAVASALETAAKVSGFAAKYDVVEVKAWTD